ncbi:MAG: NUDIX hydrolase [Erysipelotrichales bacterium]|nr:NUDIX hydrolase [Erysipelotrichales bacterium]
MELWDAYNEHFEKIENKTLVRGEKIPEGLFHLVCDIIVKHVDETYLLMQRDYRKHYGGMWEATAGGSALKGETPFECAKRELKEETGIIASNLTEVGRVAEAHHRSIYVEYLCVTDWNKDNITLQEGETISYKWVSKDELLNMCKSELVTERMQNFIEELKKI